MKKLRFSGTPSMRHPHPIAYPTLFLVAFAIGAQPAKLVNADQSDSPQTESESLRRKCYQCHAPDFELGEIRLHKNALLPVGRRFQQVDRFTTLGDQEVARRRGIINGIPTTGKLPLADVEPMRRWGDPESVSDLDRGWISSTDVLLQIVADLTEVPEDQRKFQRYLTLTHLHNNPKVTQRDLRLIRAAVSKTVNSMSDQAAIKPPRSIDPNRTILNIDLRDYGWHEFGSWEAVLETYPYGLKPTSGTEEREIYDQVESLYGEASFDGITSVRADWFIANATRPPLYHILAGIPETLDELLQRLGVNLEDRFQQGTARRVAISDSGVSAENRLVEYHPSSMGTLWLSYSFGHDTRRSDLASFPLGPRFEGNPFDTEAFEHAGGEVIFSLPNGLQAYMMIDSQGHRIDESPVERIWDIHNIAGGPVIVNGLSCIGCHKHGLFPLRDFVRDRTAVLSPPAQAKVQEIFPPQAEIDQAIGDAKQEYLRKLWLAVSEELNLAPDQQNSLLQALEPISQVTAFYRQRMDLQTVACELGLETPELLLNHTLSNRMSKLGMAGLSDGGTISRAHWESAQTSASVFQDVASYLRIGTSISY